MKLLDNIKLHIPLLPKPKKRPWDLFLKYKYAILAVLMLLLIIFYSPGRNTMIDDDKLPVQIKGVNLRVKVADSMSETRRGLMHKNDLPENEGMLFVLSFEAEHSFWMKNVLIPLDMIWISSNKEIVHIEHSAPPCKKDPCPGFRPSFPALYVLEVNGGWAIRNGIELGDQVTFSL